MRRLVDRIDRSPMNPKRWLIEYECGHEEWITRARRPALTYGDCKKCDALRGGEE